MKPSLSVDEQIEHLKDKGVQFTIMDKAAAKTYLTIHNNCFKLTAYRKTMISIRTEKTKGNISIWSSPTL